MYDFDDYPDLPEQLLVNGHVVLFWQMAVLQSAIEVLRMRGYQIVELDAEGWMNSAAMHDAVATALDFPDYYGRNLDAMQDCLRDVATRAYGVDLAASGFALVLERYDKYAKREPDDAYVVADIFATAARDGLIEGHRMLLLLQVDDPDFALDPVGATPVMWNPREWLDSNRH